MTEDLEAIDLLSEQFSEAVSRVTPYGDGDSIVIPTSVESQGLKILRMYEAEARDAPDDMDVRAAASIHMYRTAFMYYRAYNPILMGNGSSQAEQIGFLQKICSYAYQSIQTFPISPSAFLLADVFRMQKFFGTALHWYKQAETLAAEGNNTESATKAKAVRLDLQSDGKVADPTITRQTKFPLTNTPGLILANPQAEAQSASSSRPQSSLDQARTNPITGASKSGCMGVLAVVACIAIGFTILFLISRGTTASQSRATTSVQPLYRASLDTSTASTLPDRGHLTVQNWQGEHFPQTRTNYLQEADIQDWSYSGVRYALNEMYARHGYLFKDSPLRHQFQKFSWYHPVSTVTSADIEAQFTPRESANQRLLAARRAVLVQEGKAIK